MNAITPRPALAGMLAAIDEAARSPLADRHAAVAEAIGASVADPSLLAGLVCPCGDTYVRHLLHEGPDYAVVAIIWRSGQISPVHAHKTWCALGVHRGIVTEHFYAPGAPPVLTAATLRFPGDVSHGPANPDLIHRMANCCTETAITIHAYGVAYERFAQDLNLILA